MHSHVNSPLVTKLQFGNQLFEKLQLFEKILSSNYREAGAWELGESVIENHQSVTDYRLPVTDYLFWFWISQIRIYE